MLKNPFRLESLLDLASFDTGRAKALCETFEKSAEGKEWSSCPLACPTPQHQQLGAGVPARLEWHPRGEELWGCPSLNAC